MRSSALAWTAATATSTAEPMTSGAVRRADMGSPAMAADIETRLRQQFMNEMQTAVLYRRGENKKAHGRPFLSPLVGITKQHVSRGVVKNDPKRVAIARLDSA